VTWFFWPWDRAAAPGSTASRSFRSREGCACLARRVRRLAPRRPAPAPDGASPRRRRPFRDNPVLLLAGILGLVAILTFTMTLANRSSQYAPDFLSEIVLYALSVVDLTMLVALVFVLARSVIKMLVERRRGLPFARFRAKLVTRCSPSRSSRRCSCCWSQPDHLHSVDRWFNQPMDEIWTPRSGSRVTTTTTAATGDRRSARVARTLGPLDLGTAEVRQIRDAVAPSLTGRSSPWSKSTGRPASRGASRG